MAPGLDVTDVLSDPDFATILLVQRTAVDVDTRGETVETPADPFTISAVVTPVSSNDLKRLPDGARLEGAITIFTTVRLTSEGGGNTADVVTWQGRRFTVLSVDDWSQFGAGFVRATATMLDLS